MPYLADLHIHSRYSRATSRDCDLPHLDLWARYKGLQLIGTGDFTHPAWREEMAEFLQPAQEGLYTLKKEHALPGEIAGEVQAPRFMVTGEISSIYKKNGRTRKVHNVILLPSLEAAETLSHKLEAIGNIHSDGRPILGLDSRDLLEITLEACPQAVLIPAHIWTPHFSMFGAFSGFDTIEECFEDLTPYIHAVETGLSSDPPMNWRVSALDQMTLISNSDAHSPQKLGREANLIGGGLSYPELCRAIQTGEDFLGTIEFFPEEGKYHMDGHRNCQLCLEPQQTIAYDGKCPVCGKKITIGVLHRVEELADRPDGASRPGAKPFESLVPLQEVIAASAGISPGGKKAEAGYFETIRRIGPEFYILRQAPIEEIEALAGKALAEGIRRLRAGQVERTPGYDGEYGSVRLFEPEELQELGGQISLFGPAKPRAKTAKKASSLPKGEKPAASTQAPDAAPEEQLNPEQHKAVTSQSQVIAVIAGPGTGKTKTLTARIAYLIQEMGVKPSQITAVTFTNQAAGEMLHRLEDRLGGKKAIRGLTVGTFHQVCLKLLGKVSLLGPEEAEEVMEGLMRKLNESGSPAKRLRAISAYKNGLPFSQPEQEQPLYQAYAQTLEQMGALDLDDLLLKGLAANVKGHAFDYLLVDEFQDINPVQFQLICRWSQKGKGLFVIGDPDQSIYGFRGADSGCFQKLLSQYPQTETITLRQNYRSSPEILRCALSSISHNAGPDRQLCPNRPDGVAVRQVSASSPMAEGIFIAREIGAMAGGLGMVEAQNQRREGEIRPFSEIAVLCRTHRQLDLIESCLRREGIPCMVSGREPYLSQPEVRGAVCFFRSLLFPEDQPALRTSLKLNWDCPEDLMDQAVQAYCPVNGEEAPSLEQLRQQLSATGHLGLWLDAVEEFSPLAGKKQPRKLLEQWFLRQLPQKKKSRSAEQLLDCAALFSSMEDLLQALVLGQEDDLRRASGKSYASGAVRLMTLHGAKGLEFPAVFLAGVSKGSLPLESPAHPLEDREEERRLFFVGITRAKEELILTVPGESSEFLEELGPDCTVKETAHTPLKSQQAQQLSLF